MQKVFNFVEKNKLWFAVGFLALTVLTMFVPMFAMVYKPSNNINNVNLSFFTQYSKFWLADYISLSNVFSIIFSIAQIILILSLCFITFIRLAHKLQFLEKMTTLSVCICMLSILLSILYLFITTAVFATNLGMDYTCHFFPHISFFVYLILSICAIMYIVSSLVDRKKNTQTKQQQIDELKQQVKELQDQINKHD